MNTRKKAFILTEILTGMMLQAGFILTLCGAFYMLVSFSTSTQQILAAHDDGQMVISYIDNRIRNAGLGLWACDSPDIVSRDFGIGTNLTVIRGDLPVAITSTPKTQPDSAVVSSADGIYKGNVLTLLYAHRDTNDDRDKLIVQGYYNDTSPDVALTISADASKSARKQFKFISTKKLTTNFDFNFPGQASNRYNNIKYWAVNEITGIPFRVSGFEKTGTTDTSYAFYIGAPYAKATIYPMSELLNLECENMYVSNSTGERSFMIRNLTYESSSSKWSNALPHAKGILEIYMELDTNPTVPIFTLKVLVSEGTNENENTQRPDEWPSDYWYQNTNNGHVDFRKHRVHVSQASWKLYNLTKLFD